MPNDRDYLFLRIFMQSLVNGKKERFEFYVKFSLVRESVCERERAREGERNLVYF